MNIAWRPRLGWFIWLLPLAGVPACFEDPTDNVGSDDATGDGDGDPSGDGDGDGDGDPSGDGDGDPSGDGDGDPSGDGDGDPSGDGDGDPSGDGDGDPLPDPLCDDGVPVPGEICYGDSVLNTGGDVVYAAHFADVNDDGHPDLVYLLGDGTVIYQLGNGTGVFANKLDQSLCSGYFMFLPDLDNDGTADMVCAYENEATAMLGNGNGSFTQSASATHAAPVTALWVADFDSDGDDDVLWAAGNHIRIDFNNGSGGFLAQAYSHQPSGTTITSIDVADFTEDGQADVALARSTGVEVRPGTGTGINFGNVYPTGITANVAALGIGDFNGDGKPDIAYASEVSNNVGWVHGFGSGSFLSPTQVSRPGGPRRLVVADFDNDGLDDFAVGTMNNRVWIYRSLGNQGFAAPVEIPVAVPVDSLFADADANGDGVLDLIVSNINSDTVIALLSTP